MPTAMPVSKIRVLVVDDSALMRQLISNTLGADPRVEVVGTAPDPLVARDKIKQLNPDVVTLDVEMPKMDGIEFLRRLMALRPTRVLMVSSLTAKNTATTLAALELGAVDCLEKPLDHEDGTLAAFREALLMKIHVVAGARLRGGAVSAPVKPVEAARAGFSNRQIIAIGASTGGVEALSKIVAALPGGLPPIVIVQHMPPRFTASFAQRMNALGPVRVREAEDRMVLEPGQAVIAPGGFQLEILRQGDRYRTRIFSGSVVSGHAPSVDVMFHSVAAMAGAQAVGVILTGMGHDGAEGLLAIHETGAITLGQDQASALVYGMPRVAKEMGAVGTEVALEKMAGAIVRAVEVTAREKLAS